MAKITYNLSPFDPAKAKQGALCVMVLKDYSESTILNTNPSFGGVGICRYKDPGTYLITISSELYKFNEKGNSSDLTSKAYKLLLGEVQQTLSGAGGAVESNTRTVVTRSADGTYSSETTEEDNTVLVEGLTVRDNFALNALKTLMQRSEKDPSSLSNNEMSFYCDVAYQWAANMMSAAAKVRATIEDETGPSVAEESLTTNTEKLLYDMSEAIIEAQATMEDLVQAVQDLDTHICDKLQALVEK